MKKILRMININYNSIKRGLLGALLLLLFYQGKAQSCFSNTLSSCCSAINFNFNPAMTVQGNLVTVTFVPLYVFNPNVPCRLDNNTQVTFDFGDGNFSPSMQVPNPPMPPVIHTYTLANACVSNTFLVRACIRTDAAPTYSNYFACIKEYTLSVPSQSASLGIQALNTSCKTFSVSYTGGGPLPNVQWWYGDGNNSPVITTGSTSISHTYPSSGNYIITLVAEGFSACPVYTQVSVVDIVAPDFSYTVNNVCDPSQGITLSIAGYTNTLSYQWQINNLIVPATGAVGSYTATLSAPTNTVKLLISGGGCNTQVSKLVQVGTPSPNFTVNANTVCAGDLLSVIGVNMGGDSYKWTIKKPDNTFDTPLFGMNPNYMFTMPGTYTITQTITNTFVVNNVTSTCTSVSAPVSITVNAIPNATFTMPPQLCNGSVSLNIPNSTFTSYTLDYGDGTSYTGGNSIPVLQTSHVYTLNSVYTVSLTLNNNGCTDAYATNILINNLTTLSVTASSSFICQGNTAQINAFVTGVPLNAGPLTYSWTGPAGFTSLSPLITVGTGGTYSLTITSTGACPVNLAATKTITALASPVATLISVAPLNCNNLTTSAVIEISAALQQQGYYINNVFTAANPGATSPLQITVNNINNGVNYINIANGISQSCNSNLLVTAAYSNPVLSVTPTQPTSCGTGALGSAVAVAVPNTGTMSWYKVSQYPGTVLGTGSSISNLAPDNYVVKIVNGYCSATQYFSIAEPVINAIKSGPNGTCPGNLAPITINAAFIPASISSSLNYNWFQVVGNTTTSIASGAANTQSLAGGNYYVTITAANNCSTSLNFSLQQYDPITVNMEVSLPTCKVLGGITANVSGGDGNYTYNWTFNNTSTNNNSNIQSLASLSVATTVSLAINDQSGCTGGGVPTPSVIMPPSTVSLTSCSGATLQGLQNATKITNCDISACVQGGLAPYTFEWYKLAVKREVVKWHFYYNTSGQFIAGNGTQTVLVTVPTNTLQLDTLKKQYNTLDSLNTTVMYPFWTFTTSPAKPLLNAAGIASLTVPTATTGDYTLYTPVNEWVAIPYEQFVAAYSGNSGQTYPHGDFTDGTYKLYVTDANGCKYPFNIGNLTFPNQTTFAIGFNFVWGMGPVTATTVPVDVVLQDDMIEASAEILDDLGACLQKKVKSLNKFMDDECSNLAKFKDALNLEYAVKEHHYTLYYYDRGGRLTKTIPPQGVEFLTQTQINTIKAGRVANSQPSASTWTYAPHRMPSKYQYNSFGQLLVQETPEGGTINFIYDSKHRLRFSQNDKQLNANPPVYSYTKYDELSRIIEVGESSNIASLAFSTPTLAANISVADNTVFPATNNKQVTTTFYSTLTPVTYYGKPQRYIQNRISYMCIDEDPSTSGDEHYTYFSYDSHGNTEWIILDDHNGIGKNYIGYDHNLASGKILKLSYNEGRLDRFYHKYEYDADDRLLRIFTSRDGELWDNDASYAYYPHGLLKRSAIGEDHVQGLDYIYTLEGWLKAINSPSLGTSEDPGQDNSSFLPPPNGNPQDKVAADRHGMILNYYTGDYKNTGSYVSNSVNSYALASYSATEAPSLFNGNISSWVQSQLNTITTNPITARADLYQYDILNRIKQSTSLESNTTVPTDWSAINTNTATYKTTYSYDANGNILNLQRFENNGAQMDNIDYTYDNGAAGTASVSNRLSQVLDNETSGLTGRGDLEGAHTYSYDAIGNLINESGPERLNLGSGPQLYTVNTNIKWTVYGKIKEVQKAIDPSGLNRKERIGFAYDASGNRVKKEYWKDAGTFNGLEEPEELTTTFYVRDAHGNIMSTYKKYYDAVNTVFKYDLLEQPIYGSDRIGQSTHSLTLSSNTTYSNLMQPANGAAIQSEYENWLTTTNKSQLLSGTTDNLCQCKVMSITNSTVNPNYSAVSTAVEFLGIANNGIAVAEDLEGKLQFYAVLAKKYLGNADACLIFDKDGKLMKGTENVGTIDVNSKPIIVNVPGTKLYNVITLNANKQPVYHTVDMNQFGYGPVNAEGVVISVNQPMSNNTNTAVTNGFHFTAMENHVNAQAVVYTSRFTPDPLDVTKGTTEILAYDFGSGAVSPQEYLLHSIYGCGNTETGELQISPNGNKLAWYQHDKTISGFKTRTGYIYTMPLSPTKIALNGTVAVHPISDAGNYGNGALEFMSNSDDILYAQRGMYKEGLGSQKYDKNVWKYDPIALNDVAINPDNLLSPVNVSYLFGEIKRGTDGRFYIPNMGQPADKIHSYTGAAWTGTVNVGQTAYQFASALPTQVWKLFADPTQILSEYPRNIGQKDYELKDHLGNVRVVISDEKIISDNNTNNLVDNTDDFTPNVRTYSAYYPFGQLMPGQQLNSGDYRFGFNGKENDQENGNKQDYGMRTYDSRLGKFLSIDPLAIKYPWYSPYQFAGNKPIRFIDLDGAEEWDGMNQSMDPWDNPTIGAGGILTEAWFGVSDALGNLIKLAFSNTNKYNQTLIKLAYKSGYESTDGLKLSTSYGETVLEPEKTISGELLSVGLDIIAVAGAKVGKINGLPQATEGLLLARSFSAGPLFKAGRGWIVRNFKDIKSVSQKAWYKYQKQINGISGSYEYLLNGVRFDGFSKGVLLEAKGYYQWLITTKILTKDEVFSPMVDQLRRQVSAAAGKKLEWHFAEEKTMNDFKTFLEGSDEGKELLKNVELKHTKAE